MCAGCKDAIEPSGSTPPSSLGASIVAWSPAPAARMTERVCTSLHLWKKRKTSRYRKRRREDNNNNNKDEKEEDAFGVLPNELLSEILVHPSQPIWQLICKHVCQRWRVLLSGISASASRSASRASVLAREGHLEVLQWARSQGYPWSWNVCAAAASGGHLEVLQWARSQGCPWNEQTCADAARGGHLEMLQWARSQGCPWDEWTCLYAADKGHMEVLQWARSQGCPCSEGLVLVPGMSIGKFDM